jgi:hypothetical protein
VQVLEPALTVEYHKGIHLGGRKNKIRVTRKLSKNSPNIWKCSQKCSQNIKAQIESPKQSHLTAYLTQNVKDGQVKSSQTTKFRPI